MIDTLSVSHAMRQRHKNDDAPSTRCHAKQYDTVPGQCIIYTYPKRYAGSIGVTT